MCRKEGKKRGDMAAEGEKNDRDTYKGNKGGGGKGTEEMLKRNNSNGEMKQRRGRKEPLNLTHSLASPGEGKIQRERERRKPESNHADGNEDAPAALGPNVTLPYHAQVEGRRKDKAEETKRAGPDEGHEERKARNENREHRAREEARQTQRGPQQCRAPRTLWMSSIQRGCRCAGLGNVGALTLGVGQVPRRERGRRGG